MPSRHVAAGVLSHLATGRVLLRRRAVEAAALKEAIRPGYREQCQV